MATITYKDSTAKRKIRRHWPVYARNWLGTQDSWVRLLPFPTTKGPRQPYLHRPGGGQLTNPDGMFGAFGAHHVDLLVLEHCGTEQNLNDKRARYAQSHDGTILALPRPWRQDWHVLIRGGQGGTYKRPEELVQLSRASTVAPWHGPPYCVRAASHDSDWKFPVRSILCLYFVTPAVLAKLHKATRFPRHELFATHSRLAQIQERGMRDWLSGGLTMRQFR
ncbi:MAG: hypothetical protein IT580_10475 [Verrucomicrobiales bacterium]|nr:hypothetical protein [Verrucomicrobiales bacterium]